MSEIEPRVQFSYIWPGIILVIGLVLMSVFGMEPYEDWYKKNYNWLKMESEFQKGKLVNTRARKSIVTRDTGTRFQIQMVLLYKPRDLFGSAYFNESFPSWLRLPARAFLWINAKEKYSSFLEAQKALHHARAKQKYTIYVNPANVTEARLYFWDNWFYIHLGMVLTFIGFLGIIFIFIVNARSSKEAIKRAEIEKLRKEKWKERKKYFSSE
ncbi:MAG: hypothetical protein PF689_11275 [Deltaproteobacteria bacterium]|nr:hypothetical protein [Deltaproteobacteria bacterium]